MARSHEAPGGALPPQAPAQSRELLREIVEDRAFDAAVRIDAEAGVLGDGRFGRVVRGVWNETGEDVAVKMPFGADFSEPLGKPRSRRACCASLRGNNATRPDPDCRRTYGGRSDQ